MVAVKKLIRVAMSPWDHFSDFLGSLRVKRLACDHPTFKVGHSSSQKVQRFLDNISTL